MSSNFKLRVLTPVGQALDEVVSEVYLPSSNGEIGVLPGHTKYTGLLGTGVLRYVKVGEQNQSKIVISEGFCNYSDEALVVITDAVEKSDQTTKDQIEKRKIEAKNQLETTDTSDPKWALAKIELTKLEAIESITTEKFSTTL